MNVSVTAGRTELAYQGDELDAFAEAENWKRYWSAKLRPLIGDSVIEVGAGLGGSTRYLCTGAQSSWLCLDPDPTHAARLGQLVASGELPACCSASCGILADLPADLRADTILYVDVLEHIERDREELRLAAAHLKPGGRIIVLSPAFNLVYSDFDRAIGHFRRYVKADAPGLTPDGLVLEKSFYLDCVGFAAALVNRLLLKTSSPSKAQVRFWDRMIVPVSMIADRLFGAAFGKTIVMVWKKP